MIISRRTAIASLGAFLVTSAVAWANPGPVAISGKLIHVDASKHQFVQAGDFVRVSNGSSWFVTRTNSDGSHVLLVEPSNDGSYGLYIPAYRQQYKIQAGVQPTYVIRDGSL